MHSREGLTSLAGSTLSPRSPTFPCTEARQQVGPSSIRIQRSISRSVMRSEKVSLLHNAKELLLVHLAITVAVRLVDHLLQLLIRHALAELLRVNGPRPVRVEEVEGLLDLLLLLLRQLLLLAATAAETPPERHRAKLSFAGLLALR